MPTTMYPDETTITIDGQIHSYPGLSGGKFTDGDPSDPSKPPSFVPPAATINLILDNLAGAINELGGVANNNDPNQIGAGLAALKATLAANMLKAREIVVARSVQGEVTDTVALADLGLDPAGTYTAIVQLKGANTVLVTSTAVSISGGVIAVRFAHLRPGAALPKVGTPPVMVGEFIIGDFVVGSDAVIEYDLRVRREDL